MTWTEIFWNVAYALLILGAGSLVGSWLAGVTNTALERHRFDPLVRSLTVGLVKPAVLAVAAFAALTRLGIPMTTFAAVAGAAVLAVGLAVQGSLSNVASGALLLSLRPFSVDDLVTAGGYTGKVRSLQLFCTTLDTADGKIVTLPNDVVWRAAIVTWSATPTVRVDLRHVVLPGEAGPERAHDELLAALLADARVLPSPAPTVVWGEAVDGGIELTGQAWVKNNDRDAARSDLQRDVLRRFGEARVRWSGSHRDGGSVR
jgi:small conductance mechanosensitive channel